MTETPDPSAIRASKASEVTATMHPDIPCALQKQLVPQRTNKVNPRTFCHAALPGPLVLFRNGAGVMYNTQCHGSGRKAPIGRNGLHSSFSECRLTLQNRVRLECTRRCANPDFEAGDGRGANAWDKQ